jgi:hypothetical protein
METEILRGAKVRVTTETAQVGDEITSIADIRECVMVEADHSIRLAPKILFVLGPLIGAAIFYFTGWYGRSSAVGLAILAVGAFLLRDSWMHQVNARFADGRSATLYRTSKTGDALLFHAAIAKAKELRGEPIA